MNETELFELFDRVSKGKCEVQDAVDMLKHWPFETLDFACIDHHRTLRTGIPEVVYGENKSAEQIAVILKKMRSNNGILMATRVSPEKAGAVLKDIPDLMYHKHARMLTGNVVDPVRGRGPIVVLSAGTSDIQVAEEAYITAECLGNEVEKVYDVGIAGIHRLLARRELLASASVIIVVAGMEGALPSVVGGLVDRPVIAVPTSVGYGTGLGGIAALLGMLNSCAPGIAVVNIDNGFGAGCMASAINWK